MLSDVIADQVVQLRRRRDITRVQLAERCAALGAPQLTAPAVANIETGRRDKTGRRRREVTVDELTVMAKALGVPPILLIFPVGREGTVEVLPGRHMRIWPASRWFTGELPFAAEPDETGDRLASTEDEVIDWQQGAAAVALYRQHEDHLKNLSAAHMIEAAGGEWADRPTVRGEENAIRAIRRTVRQLGLRPPDLHPSLRYLDEDGPR